MIKQCQKCGGKNLYLEPRVKDQDIMTANMVALKCKDCGNWLKWCPKDERQFYINKKQHNKIEECWVIQRDDGMFWNCRDSGNYETYFVKDIAHAFLFTKECIKNQPIEKLIEFRRLQNCKPVKVEIRVVGE